MKYIVLALLLFASQASAETLAEQKARFDALVAKAQAAGLKPAEPAKVDPPPAQPPNPAQKDWVAMKTDLDAAVAKLQSQPPPSVTVQPPVPNAAIDWHSFANSIGVIAGLMYGAYLHYTKQSAPAAAVPQSQPVAADPTMGAILSQLASLSKTVESLKK